MEKIYEQLEPTVLNPVGTSSFLCYRYFEILQTLLSTLFENHLEVN